MTDVTPTPSHWGLITAADVEAEQQRTLAQANIDNTAVQACIASGAVDAVTGQQWTTFFTNLTAFCQKQIYNFPWPTTWGNSNDVIVTGDTGETMMAYEAQLVAWENKLRPKCSAMGDFMRLKGPSPVSDNFTAVVKWIAIGLVAVAGAYIVSKVATPLLGLLPARSERGARKKNPLRGRAGPKKSRGLIAKATSVRIYLCDDRLIKPRGTMFHDPSGKAWPKSSVIIGPFKPGTKRSSDDDFDGAPRYYLGRGYRARYGTINRPPRAIGAWTFVGDVSRGDPEDGEIQYVRRGSRAPGAFYHAFNKRGLTRLVYGRGRVRLYRYGSFYRLELPRGAVVDDRGFVWP